MIVSVCDKLAWGRENAQHETALFFGMFWKFNSYVRIAP